MRSSVLVLTATLAVFGSGLAACGQSRADFDAWLDAHWSAARSITEMPDHRISWRIEQHEVPPPEDIAKLRDQIARALDHPDKDLLKAYERRLAGHPDVEEVSLWDGGLGRFRFNRTYPPDSESNVEFKDVVWTDKDCWSLNNRQLALLKPGSTVTGFQFGAMEPEIRSNLSLMLNGGLGMVPAMEMVDGSVEVTPSGWSFRSHVTTTGAVMSLTGRWDGRLGTFVVERISVVESPSGSKGIGRHWDVGDWRVEPDVQLPVAHRTEEYLADGRLRRVLVLQSIAPLADGEFARVTATPEVTMANDAVRGEVTFNSVWDFLHPHATFLTRNPDSGEFDSQIPIPDGISSKNTLQVLGWVAAIMVASILVWIRVVRSRVGA